MMIYPRSLRLAVQFELIPTAWQLCANLSKAGNEWSWWGAFGPVTIEIYKE